MAKLFAMYPNPLDGQAGMISNVMRFSTIENNMLKFNVCTKNPKTKELNK